MRAILSLLAVVAATTPAAARAQEPTRADSLEAQLRALRARIDSLEQVLQRLTRQSRDSTPVRDELAALRAAARQAAGPVDSAATEAPAQFSSRTRNLSSLNPEISATADVRVQGSRPGPQEDNFDVREFEISLQSALDPYASTKIFVGLSEEEVAIEEGYAYWTGLPGHLRLDFGRFRQQVGELNRWHSHALPQSEMPLVLSEFLGDEGLVGDGLSLFWLVPAGGGALGTHELTAQVSLGKNEVLFDDGRRLSYLGHLNNFWALSPSTYFQVGGTALYGRNPDTDLQTTVFGIDARFTWVPPSRAQYQSFTLRGEGYAIRREVAGAGPTRYGGYASAVYQLSRRLFAGTRVDYVERLGGGGDYVWSVVPGLTWWQSEWVYLRAEWQHLSSPAGASRVTGDRFLVQAVWSVGPHKHETY
ncbi:MAG TPA: hypothetical protein VGA37_09655 [Gemmatimonadales bacterium]